MAKTVFEHCVRTVIARTVNTPPSGLSITSVTKLGVEKLLFARQVSPICPTRFFPVVHPIYYPHLRLISETPKNSQLRKTF